MNKILASIILGVSVMYSCGKETIPNRNLENTMWSITKLIETPISNEFGTIQCAIEITGVDVGGFKFGNHSQGIGAGTYAYTMPHDSSKVMVDATWSMHDEGDGTYKLTFGDKSFFLNPEDTRNDSFEMYYEEVNVCSDLVRYTFTLKKINPY